MCSAMVTASGEVEIDGVHLDARDRAVIRNVETFRVATKSDAELVLVDSAP